MTLIKFAGGVVLLVGLAWLALFIRGKRFALRDKLHKADAIVVVAGTRGNIKNLEGKIRTAVKLYQQGWAPLIIFSGKFSAKVCDSAELIPIAYLEEAAAKGRIQQSEVASAAKTWDAGLGAEYMREEAINLGVPGSAIEVESEALHTRENADHVADILEQKHARSIILVTSPFHQQRTYLTFAKVMQPKGIEISNHYAETGEWHPATWFLSKEHRQLVRGEVKRIEKYRAKGDLI
jgi:uncharacterized SAM-binding protein YcdF (DUF218 family)